MLGGCAEEWYISSALPNATTDHTVTEGLTSGSLATISWIQKATSQLYRRNVPLLHMSTQHPGTSLHVFYQAFPHVTTATTNTSAWVRGYINMCEDHRKRAYGILISEL